MKEALYSLFTDDPINWMKWGIVFVVLVLGYVAAVPLYAKVNNCLSWERKRDIARSRNHVIKATLLKKHPTGDVANYNWHATYRYSLNGEQKQYTAYFHHPNIPPLTVYLYYINTPKKVFCYEEYHWENYKALLLFPLMFLPWILAIITIFVLRIELPGGI